MIDFTSPDYLLKGSTDQKKVWEALRELKIFECLSAYKPVLAGTFPLDLAVEGSDLDILCGVASHDRFADTLVREFGSQKEFRIRSKYISGVKTTLARFEWQGYPVEVFGQGIPAIAQDAYKHLLVEWHLLQTSLKGSENSLRNMKASGMSTEEAFAALLGLEGDPYRGLIELGRSVGVLA